MPSPKHLFVYGTLRRHQRPPEMSEVMESLEFIGEGSAPGRIFELGDYPGAVFEAQSKTAVPGEVYKLPTNQKILRKLDDYEEFRPRHPRQSLFIRENIVVRTSSGAQLACWAYRYNTNKLKKRAPQKQAVKSLRAAPTRASR
jgi:gamma-glutamylcyclotransferase (GGCT)/AIG2-like uncharacterized protein YtfP